MHTESKDQQFDHAVFWRKMFALKFCLGEIRKDRRHRAAVETQAFRYRLEGFGCPVATSRAVLFCDFFFLASPSAI